MKPPFHFHRGEGPASVRTGHAMIEPFERELNEARGRRSRAGAGTAGAWIVLLAVAVAPSSLFAQERIDEQRELAPDGRLELAVISHAIRIAAWDRDTVHLSGTYDPDTERLEVSGDERSITIRIEQERGRRGGGPGTLELRVPRGAYLSVATVSGDVSLDGPSGTVRATTVSGGIRLTGSPERAELQAVSGAIDLDGVVPDLTLHTVSGNLRIRGAIRRLDVQSVSANVDFEGDEPMERIRVNTVSGAVRIASRLAPRAAVELESHSGRITLRLPADTSAEYAASSFSGRINNRLTSHEPRSAPRSHTLHFTVGDGSARVRISTFSGRITLEPVT